MPAQFTENAWIVLPPPRPMLDQILDWLCRHRRPEITGIHNSVLGIGATALCLRWGTYLAVLLDESKPVDPRTLSPETSMLSDQEMKRINLEFSSNLARLIRMLHEDEAGCRGLLCLCYRHLPMPQRRVEEYAGFIDPFIALTSPEFWNSAPPGMRARIQRERAVVARHGYRILANSVALAAYRNGPVEGLHAGRVPGYDLHRRRADNRQSWELMRFTSERLAAFLARFRPWEQCADSPLKWPENLAGIYLSPFFTPATWSLTESSSRIDLEFQQDQRPAGS